MDMALALRAKKLVDAIQECETLLDLLSGSPNAAPYGWHIGARYGIGTISEALGEEIVDAIRHRRERLRNALDVLEG